SSPTCFPDSVHLSLDTRQHQDNPDTIFIHFQSFLFDVHSLSANCGPPLLSTNSLIRFPTRTAFLNSLIDTILDPPIGFRHWKLAPIISEVYMSYLIIYTLRTLPCVLPSGELEPQNRLLLSLKPENRYCFEGRLRCN
ncbi:hypothetical protein EV702DRAFT_919736, partial [Suillus placidus]